MIGTRSIGELQLSCLYESQASLDAEDILGRRAIHHAAHQGAMEALECVIREGAEVNQVAGVNNITPLHYAAKVRMKEPIHIVSFPVLQPGNETSYILAS